jgi:replication factor C large subunit
MGIFAFLDAVLKEQSPREALQSSYAVDETPDDLTKWIEGNVTKVYEGEELARAYEFLANADRWLGRVRASQNYSYWRYAGDNLAAGVAASRDGTKGGWTRFGRPQFWPSSDKTTDYVARQIAEQSGVSMDTARRDVIPFLAAMTHHCKPRELTVAMAAAYDLEAKHVSFVTGSGETTNKVESVVEDAQELRAEAMEEHSGSAFQGAVPSDASEDEGEDESDADADADEVPAEPASADADSGSDDETETDDGQSGLSDFF